jgi:phosphomannomutase
MGETGESGAPAPIRFGTSGWRGILGAEFTFPRVAAAIQGIAAWLHEREAHGVVLVGHDRRLLGPELVGCAVRGLREAGVRARAVASPVPTPVVAHAVRRRRAAAGLVFTASHNPPAYHGLKVFGPWGGGIEPSDAQRIEAHADAALARGTACSVADTLPPGSALDVTAPYLEELLGALDRSALRGARLRVVYDALHGAGAGVLDEALRRSGVQVETLRAAADAGFGGCAPDPVPAQLGALARAVRRGRGLRLGLATDGDADRIAVVDERGALLSETETVALLVDHLARAGRVRRGVAISVATGSLVERVAESHGLAVARVPIGFKWLSRALVEGRADVAGEESGGFAWGPFGRDKDGILAGCLLAERVAQSRVGLRAHLRALQRRFGATTCGRSALPATRAVRERLEKLAHDPPARVGGSRVLAAEAGPEIGLGVRLALADGFLMLRASGTEPLARVYAEAPDPARLARRLRAGESALRGASG